MTIRALHLVHAFQTGGAERVLVNLVNDAAPDVTNMIGSFFPPDDFVQAIDSDRRDVRWLEKQPGQDPRVVARIRRIIRDENIDIVHAQGWGTYLEGLAAVWSCRPRPRFIYAFHGKTMEDVQQGIGTKRRLAQRFAAKLTDAIIAPSQQMATDYEQTYGLAGGSVQVLYNGIQLSHPSSDISRSTYGIPKEAWVVGFVGRLDPVKNLGTLIKVFSRLSQQATQKPVYLLLVGDGAERNALEQQVAEHGLQKQVCFAGFSDQVGAHLALMDAYVQPSFYEGHSCTLLEAMAAGLPVLTSDVGGTPEIITDSRNGLLFKPEAVEPMVDALMHLIRDKQSAATLGAAARETVTRSFTSEAMTGSYEALYRRLLSPNQG